MSCLGWGFFVAMVIVYLSIVFGALLALWLAKILFDCFVNQSMKERL
jgi:uncharacterized membrane protein YdjX (TVP38/TMEM64 family)